MTKKEMMKLARKTFRGAEKKIAVDALDVLDAEATERLCADLDKLIEQGLPKSDEERYIKIRLWSAVNA